MADKQVRFETLGQTAKKKKDIIIVILIGGIISFILISIGLAIFDTDKKKVFEQRKDVENKKDFEIVGERDYKENFALSVENKLQKNEENLQTFMESVVDENKRNKEDIKDMLLAMAEAQGKSIRSLKDSTDAQFKKLKNKFEDRFLRQENRMEEIALQKSNSSYSNGDGGDVNLNDDLLPSLPGNKRIKPPVKDKSLTDSFLDAITGTDKAPKKEVSEQIQEKGEDSNQKSEKPKFKIKLVSLDTSANQVDLKERKAQMNRLKEEQEREASSFHLATGLTQALMITGAYAPAFSSGDTEPLPVLLQAEGNIMIANDDRLSVDKCMLIGSAKGNMNSQTADIRLVSISCSLGDGKKIIEGPISGWVIGENGIPGVQGELLHKNGAWLAKTFVAGFLETFSTALSNTGRTQINFGANTNAGIGAQIPVGEAISNNAARAGAGGISQVFGKLGDYYIKMAEQIFPVIEVKGGRTVDILLKGGEDFTVKDFGRMDITSINNRIEDEKFAKISKKQAQQELRDADVIPSATDDEEKKPTPKKQKASVESIFSNLNKKNKGVANEI